VASINQQFMGSKIQNPGFRHACGAVSRNFDIAIVAKRVIGDFNDQKRIFRPDLLFDVIVGAGLQHEEIGFRFGVVA
jgi:hypothetical protein